MRHGFWEVGRFSTAYRQTFGEPPSETLRRGYDWRGPVSSYEFEMT
jgi:transcriptional regulator GlxA family with amidase domain